MMRKSKHEVTTDDNSRSSSADDHYVQRRKPRRVRSLIKSSIETILDEHHSNETDSAANSRRNSAAKRPFPFGQCRVCTDKATGAHYGVPTCEGCKGFFKRSILRKEKYRCYFGDRCIVNADNRNRCKSCRFHKCLKEGMSVEGVRMGRIPKIVKEKALAEYQLSSSSTENDEPSSSIPSPSPSCSQSTHFPLNDYEFQFVDEQSVLDNINHPFAKSSSSSACTSCTRSDAFTLFDQTNNYPEQFSIHIIPRIRKLVKKISPTIIDTHLDDEESALFLRYLRWRMIDTSNRCTQHIRQVIERMNTIINHEITHFPGDYSSLQDILTGLTDAIPFHVKNLITFARETPAINEINGNDFQKIMNNRLFDFWLIKHSSLLRNNESYVMLPNGLQYTRRWMVRILGEEMVETMFDFAQRFNAVNFTLEEQALILPIVICFQDVTLNDQETVRNLYNCYLYALYTQMLTTRTLSDARMVFHSLMQIFALLPFLNELQAEKLAPLIPDSMG